ncbi:hypothetical protein SESBI_16749 [Sesbania bispinosa]|nr:hypothetical protein SESBI_16749 [Sesbania bispinosa]
MERVDDSFDEIVEDSFEERVQDSFEEKIEDSLQSDCEDWSTSKQENLHNHNAVFPVEVKKPPLNIDLNVAPNNGFDLNKFPEDEGESVEEEFKETVKYMLKIYLPHFY